MSMPTRILIVEDSESDFELAQLEICKSVDDCIFKQVQTRSEFLEALETFQPDVILSDYSLPRFDGMSALKLAQEKAPLIPFIIWTGSMSEDVAVECMKAGANNYILKENRKRLGPAILHSIEERQLLLERRQSEEKLRKSEARFVTIFENSPVAIGISRVSDGRIVHANPAFAALYGYSRGEIIGRTTAELNIWANIAEHQRFITQLRNEKHIRDFEATARLKSGQQRDVILSGELVEIDGEPCLMAQILDITEHKLAEQKYQDIFENSAEGVFQSLPEGRFVKVNPAMARIYGYDSPEDMISSITSIADQIYVEPADRDEFTKLLQVNDQVDNFEMKNLRKDKSIFWTHTSARTVRDTNGNVLYYEGFLQDITKRKQAEERLRESEERFRALIENSLDNISLLAADGTLIWENPSTNRTLGYEQDEFIERNIFELMHPDDIGWTSDLFAQLAQEPGSQRRGVFRLKHRDGSWRWIEATATNMLNDPSVQAVVINYRNVTERKMAEEALSKSEERYRGLAENFPNGVVTIFDKDLRIVFTSGLQLRESGMTEAEFIGRHFVEVSPAETWKIAEPHLKAAFKGEVRTYETVYFNNTHYFVSVAPLHNSAGSIDQILVISQNITERKLAEMELQEARELFRKTFHFSPVATVLMRVSDRSIVDVNSVAEELFGYARSEMVGRPTMDFDYWVDKEERQRMYSLLLQQGHVTNHEFSFRNKSGQIGRVILSSESIEQQNEKYILTTFIDITDRKRVEIELQQRNDDLSLINAINEAAIYGVNLDGIVNLLSRELKRIFSATGSTLYMLSPDGASLTMQQYVLPPVIQRQIERLIGSTIPLIQLPVQENGFFKKVLSSQRGCLTSDSGEIQTWMSEFIETPFLPPAAKKIIRKLIPQIFDVLNIRSTIAIPLISNGRTIGLLDVSSASLFTEEDLRRIEAISGQLTAAIQRQQANEKVRHSEEFLHSVQNSLSASIAILDENGVVVQVNSAWRKFGEQNGLQHTEYCIGMNYLDICDSAVGAEAEEARQVARGIREVISGQRREVEIEYPCHSPEEKRWFTLRITKFEDGEHLWVVLAHENITERKQAEESFKESSEQFRTLFEASPEAIMLVEPQGKWRILDCNSMACSMNGFSREELIGKSVDIFNPTQGTPQGRSEYLDRVRNAGVLRYETSHRRKDGSLFPIEISTTLITLGGREVVLGIDRDITERKQAEQALLESEQRYRALFEDMPVAIWEDDLSELKKYLNSLREQGIKNFREYFKSHPAELARSRHLVKFLNVNKAAFEMYGAGSKEELIASAMEEMGPGELEYWVDDLTAIANGETNHGWEGGDLKMDNTPIEISLNWTVVPGYEHDYSRVIFTIIDITERKQMEEALRESEERFRTLVNSMNDIIFTLDREQRHTGVFGPWVDTAGLSPENFLGKTARDIMGDQAARIHEDANRRAMEGQSVIYEWSTSGANGMQSYQTALSPLRNVKGEIIGLVGVGRDITERKQAEDGLKQSHSLLSATFESTADGILVVSPDGKISNFNRKFTELWRIPQSLIARKDDRLLLQYVLDQLEDPSGFIAKVEALYRSPEETSFDEIHFLDGRVFERYSQPQNLGDTILGRVWSFRDITQRKQAETAEREQRALAEALRDTAETLNSTLDYGEVLDHILTAVERVVPHDAASILLIDKEVAHVTRVRGYEERGFHGDVMEIKLSLTDTTNLREIVETGQPVVVSDTRMYPGWKSLPATDWLRSNVGAPISVHGEPVGFIILDSETPGFFTPVHAERLKAFANQAAIAIQNARLLKQAQEDVAERKQAENAEREQRTLAEALRDTAETLNSTLEYGDVLDHILAAVERVVPHNAGTIMLINGEFAEVVRSHGYEKRGNNDEIIGIKLPLAKTNNLHQILETKQPVIVHDTHVYVGWKRLPITDWLRSSLGAPISMHGEVIGFIVLDSETPGFFTSVHAERLKAFANQAALAIRNARLLKQAQDEIAERKQSEAALQESERRYRALFENSPIAILEEDFSMAKAYLEEIKSQGVVDLNAHLAAHPEIISNCIGMVKVIDVSHAAVKLYGVENKSVMLGGLDKSYPNGSLIGFKNELLTISNNRQSYQGENIVAPLHGDIRSVSVNWVVAPGSEQSYSKVLVSLVDITERKQAETALRESEEKYRLLFDSNPLPMWIYDLETLQFIKVNDAAINHYGYSEAEFMGMTIKDIRPPADILRLLENVSHVTEGIDRAGIWSHIIKDGSVIQVEIISHVVEFEGRRAELVLANDVTERRKAENELRASEERFRQLADNIKEIFWMTDAITGKEIYISPAAEKIWGRSIKELMTNPNAFMDSIYPEDVSAVQQMLNEQRAGKPTSVEYRTLRPDGSICWVWDRAFPIFDETGRVARLTGIAADITERKQAENALRQSENRLRQVIDLVPHFIFAKDGNGQFILANQAIAKAYGTTVDELSNRQEADFAKSIEEVERFHADDMDVIKSGQSKFIPEERITDADGNIRILSTTKIPFTFSGSPSPAILGISIDITERKQAEQEITRHLTEMEALYENGLALGQLLDPREIGERVIATFARYLSWHHVTIRLVLPDSEDLELIAYSLPGLSENEKIDIERHFQNTISKVGQGLSGWAVQTGQALRTGDVHGHPQYVGTQAGIQSGLYMPLKIGERILGVISVESEKPDAFTLQDERLLATLATQAAVAFENARLYQTNQRERERFSELFENSPIATWLEDFTGVISWMEGLRKQGVTNLKEYLQEHPEAYRLGISLIDILDVNHAAVVMNGARDKSELLEKVHGLMINDVPTHVMIDEMELIWRGYTSFGYEMSSRKLDGTMITGIQRIYIPVVNNEPDYTRVIVTNTDITDRVDVENRLRTSEVHYRELADSITDIFFELDKDLRYSHWNKASELLTGLPAENAIGRSMQDVFGVSDEQTRIEKIYREVLEKHQSRTFETVLSLNDLPRAFEINAYPSTRGVAVVAKDVTERKRSESLLQKRFELMEYSADHILEELMQKALDEISEWTNSTIGFFQFLEEDQVTPSLQVWSTDTFKHFHTSEGEVMHMPAGQAGVWAEAVLQRRAVIHNDYESMPGKKGLPEGHAPLVRELIVPIIRNERIMAVIGIGNKPQEYTRDDLELMERFADYAWDVIERKQMVTELAEERNQLAQRVEERTADLSRANSNLARALRVKDEFLASMSHELRTPLNAILGLSESLTEQTAGPLNEKQQKYLTTISESGHHLLALINDILDLAKIEAGQITLDINKVDVNQVSQASLRMIKQLAQKKNLDVSVEIDEKLGLMWADERRLKQMMVNLLSNAVKFTPEGGKLGLQIQGNEEDNKVMITVWDTGIGIKEGDFQRLFQPFVQLDSGLAREATGTGLGLALVAQMSRLHGGSVNVTSELGKGSRFTIVLPWQPAQAMTIAEKMKVTGRFRAIKEGQGQPTILLVEDTQEVVMMIKDYLEIAGYKVVTAQDGLDGIAQAKFSHPDLILMDVQMPRMDGLEATQKLRLDPEFKQTPILALTALAMPNDRERCLAAGMDEYISKPVNLRALVRTIQNCLSLREEKTLPR